MSVTTTVATGASFTVPAGITKCRATARGAAAVPNYFTSAARGAIVQSILAVAAAQVLPVSAIPGGVGGAGNGTGGGNGGAGGAGVNIAGLVFAGGAGGNGGTVAATAAGYQPSGDPAGGDAGMPAGAAGTQILSGSSQYPLVVPGVGASGSTGGAAGTGPGGAGTAGANHSAGGAGGAGGAGTNGTTTAPGGFSNFEGAPGGGGGGGGYAGGGGAAGSEYSGGSSGGGAGGSSLADTWVGFNTATVADAQFTVAGAPNAATLTYPIGNTLVASTRAFSFQIGHNAATPGDVLDAQSNLDIQYRIVGAPSWTALSNLGAVIAYQMAAGALATGAYEWQARTWSDGVAGAWSASDYFTVAVPPAAPTVTSPTSGATVNVATVPVIWSAPGQAQSQARLTGDIAGAADPNTIYSDTGVVTSSAGSATLAAGTNNVAAHVQVRVTTTVGGFWSDWADVPVSIAWQPPARPSVILAPDASTGTLVVTVVNPTPTGNEPTPDTVWLYVTEAGVETRRAILTPNAVWTYLLPAGDVGVRAVAIYTPTGVSNDSGVVW